MKADKGSICLRFRETVGKSGVNLIFFGTEYTKIGDFVVVNPESISYDIENAKGDSNIRGNGINYATDVLKTLQKILAQEYDIDFISAKGYNNYDIGIVVLESEAKNNERRIAFDLSYKLKEDGPKNIAAHIINKQKDSFSFNQYLNDVSDIIHQIILYEQEKDLAKYVASGKLRKSD